MNRRSQRNALHEWRSVSLPAIGALVVALASACTPHITQFTATPRHVCAGEPVQVEWRVVGSARMRVTPPNDRLPDGPVSEEGRTVIAPITNTNVELQVTRLFGKPTGSVQEIEVAAGSSRREILAASLGNPASTPSCTDGRVRATVHAANFSPHLKVATVVSHPNDGRTYEVQHAGRSAILAPGAVLTVFEGTALAGDWILSAPVGEGETCATVPPVLVLDVTTQCFAEGTP
jgi:hypothetical protein